MTSESKKRVWCYFPWFEMNFAFHRGAAPCCYFTESDNLRDEINTIWNSDLFKSIRHSLVSGNVEQTPCSSCYARALGWSTRIPDFTYNKDVADAAVAAYIRGDIELSYKPPIFHFGFPVTCNLDCIMCSQKELRKSMKKLPVSLVEDFFKNHYLRDSASVLVVGGEPFVEKGCTAMLRRLADLAEKEDLSKVEISILTNGYLINEWINVLEKIPKIHFAVSLDSTTEKVYEHIRRKSRWERVRDNLFLLRDMGKTRDWRIGLSFLVMRSTLPNLAHTIQWCHAEGFFDIVFHPVAGRDLDTENFYVYNYLLEELDDWPGLFDAATMTAEILGYPEQVLEIRHLKELVTCDPWISREKAADILGHSFWSTYDLELIYNDKCRMLNGGQYTSRATHYLFTGEILPLEEHKRMIAEKNNCTVKEMEHDI